MTRKIDERTLEAAEWYSDPAGARARLRRRTAARSAGFRLHAMSDHVLIAPEGDTDAAAVTRISSA